MMMIMMHNENGDENSSWHGEYYSHCVIGECVNPAFVQVQFWRCDKLRGAPVRRVSKARVPFDRIARVLTGGVPEDALQEKQGSSVSQGLGPGLTSTSTSPSMQRGKLKFSTAFWIPDLHPNYA